MATATPKKTAALARKPAAKATAPVASSAPAPATAAKAPKAPVAAKPPKTSKMAKPVKATKPVKADKTEKAEKPRKPKLVRDSFTIPKAEYAVLDDLKQRAVQAGAPAKKSELLRAGIKALAAMDTGAFLAAVKAVPAIKTGRPAKD